MAILVTLCLYKLNTKSRSDFEDIGYRTGYISICQLPLLFFLAMKTNIIGYLTGTSYEKLNWIHRWVARSLLLTTSLHMGYWLGAWWPYGSYVKKMITTDPTARTGLISWAVLAWIVLSSFAPIRGLSHEIFVIQHFISFTALTVFIYLHAFPEQRHWVWIPVAIFFFDRVVRALRVVYANLSIFHPRQRKDGAVSSFWAFKADFTPLPHNATRVVITNPPIRWSPGQHVFLSCHSVVPLQSHPFTISSLPEDGKMEFIIKAERGATKSFLSHAEKLEKLPSAESSRSSQLKTVAIEGPYGCIRPLRQFDTVVLLAGSTGATFTLPLLRDIVRNWLGSSEQPPLPRIVTRRVRLVWVVKSRGQFGWLSEQLERAVEDVAQAKQEVPDLDVEVEISVYVTCDDSFAMDVKSVSSHPEQRVFAADEKSAVQTNTNAIEKSCGPAGSCCCRATIEDEDAIASAECTCDCAPVSSSTSQSSDLAAESEKPSLYPGVAVFSGRPQCRNIIRRSLEQALGESAVVVCGPKGMVAAVRQDVVYLSDERAVHKGTGAQGIYLHTECFGY